MEKIGKKNQKSKVEEFKKFKNLECIKVESSWEAELINQVIQNIKIRKELKDRLEANKEEKEACRSRDLERRSRKLAWRI